MKNIDYYLAQAEAKGLIAKAVGKGMKKAGKSAANIGRGATQAVEAVSRYQQTQAQIAQRLNGVGGNPNAALGGAVQPRLKAW